MSAPAATDIDNLIASVPILARRLEDVHVRRRDLDQEVSTVDYSLDELLGLIAITNQRLARKKAEPRVPPPPPAPVVRLVVPEITSTASVPASIIPPPAPVAPSAPLAGPGPGMTLDDFKLHMGEILKGSLDAVSDKLSDRISGMLKELGTLSGPARAMRIEEFKQSGEYEMVDFSSLYAHSAEQVTSNLKDVGVEEKETKGVDSTLERLRKLRAGKPKI
ncbi:MAG: hypothetical protein WCO69_00250 [Candidatus Omnitrophota bacterium]